MFLSFSDKNRIGVSIGYQGCVKQVAINGEKLNLRFPGPTVQNQSTVLGSCSASPCVNFPCQNGASCIATSAKSYQCICTLGYQGKNCEKRGTTPEYSYQVLIFKSKSFCFIFV